MAYREKDTKKWSAQWFETTAKGEKKKRRKRGFETKREALEYERQKKLNSSRSMDMKLSEFMEVYFEDKQNELKDRTMKNKRYMMEQHIIPYFGEQMLSEITASQIIQWQNEMQTKGFSESYLRMIQNQLTSLFTHASRIYDLHTNPCKKVKRMGNSDSRSLDFWTTEEYQRFIQTIEPGTRYYLIFEILFWTGCRIGELLALTKGDISFENNQISITKTYYRTGRQDVITEPKTKQSVRMIEIPEFLKQEIKDFVDGHYGMPNDERLFPIVQEAVQHKMKRHIAKAGVKNIRDSPDGCLLYDKAAQTITALNSAEPLSVSVYNSAGALLLVKGTLHQGETLSVSALPQGLNIVVATGSTATHTLKFIK